MKLITGNSHPTLAVSLAKCLAIPLVNCTVQKFSNTEIEVKINENVRNEHIFILQTGGFDEHNSINDFIMETLILIDACRRSNAKSITLLMPCYPYA
jgi:ribose-phosphate pyrophosphokinase